MFEIVLPQSRYIKTNTHRRISGHSECLWSLNSRKDVTVFQDFIPCLPRLRQLGISDNNAKLGGYFSVNGNVFLILDTDRPHVNLERWLDYYKSAVKGFFLCSYYKDLKEVFDKSHVKVFPCFGAGRSIDNDLITNKLPNRSIYKDIPIFFRGKFKHNIQRPDLCKMVKTHFPDSYIEDSSYDYIDPDLYFNLLQRAKIVWEPPTVPSFNPSCQPFCLREREAMCVESLCVRQPIDVFTPEEVVAGEHFVEVKRDNSNLIEVLEKYLFDEDERLRIARNGRLFFEKNCTSIARATYLLEKCISVI